MWNLRIDAATAEVVRALERRGIQSVILKGPAFAEWYPENSDRTYVDGDVWVAPGDVEAAEAVLVELGFVAASDELDMPRWWVDHSSGWERDSDRGKIDLHRKLQGTGEDPQAVWDIVWPRTVEFTLGGHPARRMPEAGRALFAVLHAVGHGVRDILSRKHLDVALGVVGDDTWTAAMELAGELGAIDAFAAGIRLVPEGVALAERIGAPEPRSVTSVLMASTPPSVALGLEELHSASGLGRLRIILRKLFPPAGFIRLWWPPAKRNSAMLMVGYLYRPFWLARRTPAGYRAWRAARRSVNSSS